MISVHLCQHIAKLHPLKQNMWTEITKFPSSLSCVLLDMTSGLPLALRNTVEPKVQWLQSV